MRGGGRGIKTAVVWQCSHTCHHQRSPWQILHFFSPFFPPPSPLPFHSLQSWAPLLGCVCVYVCESQSEKGREKLQTFLCMWGLRWEESWDECVYVNVCACVCVTLTRSMCVCQSQSGTGRWEGSVSCHIWGETRVQAEVRLFSGVWWSSWMKDLKKSTEAKMERLTLSCQLILLWTLCLAAFTCVYAFFVKAELDKTVQFSKNLYNITF